MKTMSKIEKIRKFSKKLARDFKTMDHAELKDDFKKLFNKTKSVFGFSAKGIIKYSDWLIKIEPKLFKNTEYKLSQTKNQPLISVVVPCYNTPKKYIDALIKSVLSQIYQNWELCLVDGSSDDESRLSIKQLAESDQRIKYISLKKNNGISENTNKGINNAKGKYVGFMDHDDVLSPYALAEVVIAINENKSADIIYSDEDKLSEDGKFRMIPFFKPDWSPELLLSVNYITHFLVVKKSLLTKVGYLRKDFDGSQDYDLLLRLTEKTANIVHIPKILYHWRLAHGSTAGNVSNKSYADDAGQNALRNYLERNKINGEVTGVVNRPTNYRIKYNLDASVKASIIIPFKDKPELLSNLTDSIFNKTKFPNYELILVSNNSIENETQDLLAKLSKRDNVRVVEYNHPFNYSAVNNYGRKFAKGEVLVFLNNDMKVLNEDWLYELVSNAQREEVGVVGGLLLYPDKTIQHAGVIMGMGGMAGHVFRHRKLNEFTEFGSPYWSRNYIAVTGACQTIKTSLFDKLKGFDEEFVICGSDVTLCIKAYELGYQNIYSPHVQLIHYESKSVVSYKNIPPSDYDNSLKYYGPYLGGRDPYFNRNLNYMDESISLGGFGE